MNTVYTMVGLPGSGKSTFANQNQNCSVVSTDEIRAELFGSADCQKNGNKVFSLAFRRVQEELDKGHDVIFDATNITRKSRKRILKFKANHVAVYVSTDKETCKKRQALRDRKVPFEVIEKMANNLTVPTVEEGFQKVIKL